MLYPNIIEREGSNKRNNREYLNNKKQHKQHGNELQVSPVLYHLMEHELPHKLWKKLGVRTTSWGKFIDWLIPYKKLKQIKNIDIHRK